MNGTPESVIVPAFSHELSGPLDRSHFERLYEANSRPILAYALAITGHRDIAEDITQETFCRVLAEQHAARLSAMDATTARRYLFRVATNLVHDRRRLGKHQPASLPDEPFADPHRTPDPDARLDVQRILAQLKPRSRELLWLAYVEGMDHAEIAQATGLSRLSVRILLFRARKQARECTDASQTRSTEISG